jgi:phosphoribosyl-ATP pyrophosphohydrolase/phosphoribosyl-AMP cyclohydrolase
MTDKRIDLKGLKFNRQKLIPAIIQDYKTKKVLMVAYMNKESLRRSIKTGKTCFWSRSRKEYWIKGRTSGNYQFIKSIFYDCDMDALLVKVRQKGVACHTGKYSCFFRRLI